MNRRDFRSLVTNSLIAANLWSLESEELIIATAAQESHLGEYITQIGGGPALGVFQMEPDTYNDIINNFLDYRDELSNNILIACDMQCFPDSEALTYNWRLAALMCRVHYLRIKENLPPADNVEGMAAYWKKYYNTELGKGTVEEFIINYNKYVELK